LTLPLFQERSVRLEVADQSGRLIGARVLNPVPPDLGGGVEDPFALDIRRVPGNSREVVVGWLVLVCEYRGRLLLDETGRSLELQLAPSPGCDLAPIAQAVVLEFAVDVDATTITGRHSRDPLVALDRFTPTTIAFADRNVGWIGGTTPDADALVLHTTDGGATWAPSGLGEGRVAEIAVIDTEQAFATLECTEDHPGCRTGTFRWVEDFGGWEKATSDRFLRVDFSGENGVAVALPGEGEGPVVPGLRLNDDGGNTEWPPIANPCPAEMNLADAERTSPLDLVVLCLAEGGTGSSFKTLLASGDGGVTWAERSGTEGGMPVMGTPTGFDLAADGTGWLWGTRTPLLATTDAGASWSPLDVVDGDVRLVLDASYLGDGAGFILVHDPDRQLALLLWTRDGQTWDELRSWPLR
jgi:photosystem II stability/assembly factor-like uncharacterized protein